MPTRRTLLIWAISGAVSWPGTVRAEPGSPTATVGPSTTPTPTPSVSTCLSRTINYITETLPQQCLRTDWSSNVSSPEPQYGFIIITTGEADDSTTIIARQGEETPATSSFVPSEQDTTMSDSSDSTASPSESASTPMSSTPSAASTEELAAEEEEDPLLDAANFVSFEEWKAKMLEKTGQSPETLGGGHKNTDSQDGRRQSGAIHQALDSLGDDAEIELDFGGFVDPDTVASALPSAKIQTAEEIPEAEPEAVAAGVSHRSKNAGTTSKERYNYASFDCAATILKTNPECKGANYVLSENKDSYMLNACTVKNKFLIVELCNDILIDTIALGNYEFFSSTFRQVRFSVSDHYPVKLDKWRVLGTFEAQNRRGVQAFLIESSLIWTRYLRIEFLAHYGSEYYCPVSMLRVHGTTMMDEVREALKAASREEETEEVVEQEMQSGQVQEQGSAASEVKDASEIAPGDLTIANQAVPSKINGTEPLLDNTQAGSVLVPNATTPRKHMFNLPNCRGPGDFTDNCPRTNYFSPLLEQFELFASSCPISAKFCNMELTKKIETVSRAASWSSPTPTPPSKPSDTATFTNNDLSDFEVASVSSPISPVSPQSDLGKRSDTLSFHGTAVAESVNSAAEIDRVKPESSATANQASMNGTALTNSTTHLATRTPVQPAPAATPSTQESFFKSVHKRLQLLEANSTLSLQYIEEQSRLLREAFTKVEKRQLSKTSNFLASLNETVLSELREFRTQYDQIWQSTILELSSQREQSVKEASALSARLAILADEVIWQKRLVYLQFGLILLCLSLFVFLHSPAGSEAQRYLELPVLRDILTRSPPAGNTPYRRMRPRASTGVSIRSDDPGVFDSPSSSPSRPVSRSGLSWALIPKSAPRSEDESDEQVSKSVEDDRGAYRLLTPPTEVDAKANGSAEEVSGGDGDGLLEPGPEAVLRRALSSPALGREDAQGSDNEGDCNPATEPPRVAELAREAEQRDGEDDGLRLLLSPPGLTVTHSDVL